MITTEIKTKIVEAINHRRGNYGSDNKMSIALGINNAQLSRIRRGDIENVLSDANWVSIARKLDVNLGESVELVTAETPVYSFIINQLKACQGYSLSGLLCDKADIGKTYAAKCYIKTAKNAVYIDCSQVKSKQRLVRGIAKEFGVGSIGKYTDVYQDLAFYLGSIPNPLIILDEAGDLDYAAFLELKALWNATEGRCGWYMMGADGLKHKIEANLGRQKVGYQELFSRYGSRFQKVTPDGKEAMEKFTQEQIALIGKANNMQDIKSLYVKTQGSLRRIRIEIMKIRKAA